ncbi:LRR receptor-like serine/threonine-protein kinase FLS2 [Impatiens glandulifera]|uniref:LRR receptor-like serine/threonine-protein kinase FLS2 n=1 Tax=Impatiens glandulifera TaxID=253017 RepID=UPI001FB180E6|nr:LRR receptor-like serine/threonine-protein kinase FLS2 [Impatiens glandulifera]
MERNALLSFKEDLVDPSGMLSSWNVSVDCCKWNRVECNVKTGRVISLNLRNQDSYYDDEISGKLNSSLVNLKELRYLDLSMNNFKGLSIPSFIGSFERLRYLNLSGSSFGGVVPPQLGNLSNLVYLVLGISIEESYKQDFNNLVGNDMSWLSELSSLKHLDFSGIDLNLTSSDHLFQTISNTSRLEILDLSYCSLGGFLPNSLGNLSNLKTLDLAFNYFVGDIPKSIGNLTSLVQFDISWNQLNGSIPESLGKLSCLSLLRLSGNPLNSVITERHLYNLSSLTMMNIHQYSYTNINLVFSITPDWIPPFKLEHLRISSCRVGPGFPTWLRNQHKLKYLIMFDAMLSGPIPDWFLNLSSSLQYLDLSNNSLSGRVSNTFVSKYLIRVDLSYNHLEGPLPQFSSSNINSLNLGNNMLNGTIPHNIGQLMPNLAVYDLSNNYLHGSIPCSMGNMTSLYFLWLNNNNFVGEIPSLMGNMRSLSSLSLNNNSLVGKLPSSMGNMSSLDELWLSNNKLVGEIPSSTGNLRFLRYLMLNNNNLGGEIPHSLHNCTQLSMLNLADNMFSGEIPSWIRDTTKPRLKVLKLRSNLLIGHIPKQLCNLSRLHFLDLAHNHLSGTIPLCLGYFTSFTADDYIPDGNDTLDKYPKEDVKVNTKGSEFAYKDTLYLVNLIDLSANNLTGVIPKAITNLTRLWSLNLSMNHLTGRIPDQIGSLKMLETLDLSFNRLSGPLPPSLAYMTSLDHLNLSYNDFEGRIPTGNQLQTLSDPYSIYMNNPRLCGAPLTTKCSDDNRTISDTPITTVVVDANDHEDDDKDELRWILVSAALGFAVGFWGFIGPLVIKQSWRRAYFGFVEDKLEAVMTSATRLRLKLMKKSNNGI